MMLKNPSVSRWPMRKMRFSQCDYNVVKKKIQHILYAGISLKCFNNLNKIPLIFIANTSGK